MASARDMNTKAFCDEVYAELSGVARRIKDMRDKLERTYGAETDVFDNYDRHLCELADYIEWKLQILSHACPYDWKGSAEYAENIASVAQIEKTEGPEFSGGYIGG